MIKISFAILSLFLTSNAFAGCKFETCRSDEKCMIKGQIAGGSAEINWSDQSYNNNDSDRRIPYRSSRFISGIIRVGNNDKTCSINSHSISERFTHRCENQISVTTYGSSLDIKNDDEREDCRIKGLKSKGTGSGTSQRLVIHSSAVENDVSDTSICEIDFKQSPVSTEYTEKRTRQD